MDPRIREAVNKVWADTLDYEYHILEEIQTSLGRECCRLIDIGCGSKGILRRKGDRLAKLRPQSLGIDLDLEALARNPNVEHRTGASCYSLPLADNSVDIIVSRWIFEHLEAPEKALAEFARVLRKGGFVYLKTPNLWNYSMMLSWATPVTFHNRIAHLNHLRDNTRTFYRANTKRRLAELASDAGLVVRRMETYSYSYMYYAFNKELFLTMRGISRLAGKCAPNLRQTLLCTLQKP
jgi:SAM-dependent methyltransferase